MDQEIKAVIFDLDGTLVDSMWIWTKIDHDFIQRNGLGITPGELMADVAHFSFRQTASHFKAAYNMNDSVEDIQEHWLRAAELEYSSNVPLKPGVREFLDRLKGAGIPMAIATSNSHHLLNTCLAANHIEDYFAVKVTTDDTAAHSKKEPDVYLLAAKGLGVEPENIVVFEDLPHAMQGARKAGMKVVGVWDSHTDISAEEAASNCDLFIRDFHDLINHWPQSLPQ